MNTVFRLSLVLVLLVVGVTSAVAVTTYFSEDFESYTVPVGMRVASPTGPGWGNYDGAPTEFFVTSTTPLVTKALDGTSMQVVSGGSGNKVEYFKDLRGVIPSGVGISELSWDAFVKGYDNGQGTSQCDFGLMDIPSYLPQIWWEYWGDGTGWQLRQWGLTDPSITTVGAPGMLTDEPVHLTIAIDFDTKKLKGSVTRLSDGFLFYETSWVDFTGTATANSLWIREQYLVPSDSIDGMTIDNILITNTEGMPVTPGTLTGKVVLSGYSGDVGLAPVRIELIPQDGGATRTEKLFLAPDGLGNYGYTIENVDAKDYSVAFSACKWLRKIVTGVTIPSGGTKTLDPVTLLNGDVDGDTHVTSTDVSIVLGNIDMNGQ